jgi:SecD/SecF fusion protein
MNNILGKLVFIGLLVALCLWSVIPPDQKIRLGKDLQGGVSLVYAVKIAEGADADEVLAQTIDVLKDRVNPQGVLDIAMQPVGRDRIEVVMPLPSPEVRELQLAYRDALDAVLANARLTAEDLESALEAGEAASRFGGGVGERTSRLESLQAAWSEASTARKALAAAEALDPPDQAEVDRQLDRLATAEIRIEDLRDGLLAETLREQRLLDILALDGGETSVDDEGRLTIGESERTAALSNLRVELPHLADAISTLEIAYAAYEAKRTGLDDPEDLKRLLRGAGVLEFRIAVRPAAQDVPIDLLREQLAERGPNNTDSVVAAWFPINDLKQWTDEDKPETLASLQANPIGYFQSRYNLVAADKEGRYYLLLYTTPERSMTHADGEQWAIRRAGRTVDDLGRPAVSFGLDASGGSKMRRLTTPNINQPMAIVLDGEVYTAPNLNSAIGSSGVIQGNFGEAEITYLIRVLAAGSLEARLSQEPISTSILGPSIGQDNLVRGLEAVAISVAVVALIMVLYYFGAGLVADIALLVNAIMIFGIMAMIDGTFTLPGLAGIALTIGMAVDANVLIFERVREEIINNGEDIRTALRLGFAKAASAILDGNITNLIVCFILYQTAATEVKGFALTLSIGVLATLFTALFVSRVIFAICTEVFGIRSLPMLPTVVPAIHRLLEPKIDWIALRIPLFGSCLVLAVGSLMLFFGQGADVLETEFRGGVSVVMTTRAAEAGEAAGREREAEGRLVVPRGEIEAAVHELGAETSDPILAELANATVLTVGPTDSDGAAAGFQIKVANPAGIDGDTNISNVVVAALVERFGDILDVTRPVHFSAEDASDHSPYTFPLERRTLGESIGRDAPVGVGDLRGGVAVVVEGLSPAITARDLQQRLDRMRNQPDFADSRGRRTEVVGLERVGEADGETAFSAFAIMVSDDDVSSLLVDLETWDRSLASREFALVQAALTREASLDQVSSFSPKVAQNLAASAIVAVILSLLGMLVYIWFRFGSLRYSVCAISALVFNISICLGAIALSVVVGEKTFNGVRVLDEFRIDLNVVAGLLTIVGYSLNDTIVILDRIRENRGKLSYASRSVVNNSINQTFSRTIMTSGTTITSAIILYVLGGTGIRPFAFTFLVGLVAATFSSVAIAAPLTWSRGGGSRRSDEASESVSDALAPATTG